MFQVFGIGTLIIAAFVLLWIWNSINIIKEWERGVVLRLGRLLPEAKGAAGSTPKAIRQSSRHGVP